MAEIFLVNLLDIKSENMMKLEKIQQNKEMISQQDICQILYTTKIISKQKELDANTKRIPCQCQALEKTKKQYQNFTKEQEKFCKYING